MSTNPPSSSSLIIGLNAVIAAVEATKMGGTPKVLCTRAETKERALPYGAFDPARHRTFDLGLRDFVSTQTNMTLGYVEQLYTFGDAGRESPSAIFEDSAPDTRIISIGYLALTPRLEKVSHQDTGWKDWYDFFPWEDWRNGEPALLKNIILPHLTTWAEQAKEVRMPRLRLAFGFEGLGWEEERVLDRYELMYEAGLIAEAFRGENASDVPDFIEQTGQAMASDHRRILATAIGRLRGKLRYRPVIFDMMPETFTLLQLQRAVEAIIGFNLHKQNFRRGIENSGLAINSGKISDGTGGRPAAMFMRNETASLEIGKDKTIQGLTLPRLREKISFP